MGRLKRKAVDGALKCVICYPPVSTFDCFPSRLDPCAGQKLTQLFPENTDLALAARPGLAGKIEAPPMKGPAHGCNAAIWGGEKERPSDGPYTGNWMYRVTIAIIYA
jgi:hypothetical protein